jgi:hypothetical protein
VELASSDDEHIINFHVAVGEPYEEDKRAIELVIVLGASSKAFPSMIFDIINLFEDVLWAILQLNGCASQKSKLLDICCQAKDMTSGFLASSISRETSLCASVDTRIH